MARSKAAIDDPFSGRRRPDSGHRPRDPLQAVGRVGAAYPRRGRGALKSRARAKVLAAAARLSACRDVPAAGADSGNRPWTRSKPLGALGLLIRDAGVHALCCRARAKVLAAPTRPTAWRESRLCPDSGHRPRDPLQAVGRVGAAYPRRGRAAFSCHARAKVLAAPTRPTAWRDVTAAVAAACARKLEAWPTCLVRTAELGDCEESSTLAWAWH